MRITNLSPEFQSYMMSHWDGPGVPRRASLIVNGIPVDVYQCETGHNASHEFAVAESLDCRRWFWVAVDCDIDSTSVVECPSFEDAICRYHGHW